MKWLISEISNILAQLGRWQTWVGLALIGTFLGLAYLVSLYAFRTDVLLVFMHRAGAACRELTNGTIIAMFCGMIFFTFTAVLTLGEFQRFVEYQRHAAHREARQSLIWCIIWGVVALGIAVGALVFFNQYCR